MCGESKGCSRQLGAVHLAPEDGFQIVLLLRLGTGGFLSGQVEQLGTHRVGGHVAATRRPELCVGFAERQQSCANRQGRCLRHQQTVLYDPVLSTNRARVLVGGRAAGQVVAEGKDHAHTGQEPLQLVARHFLFGPGITAVTLGGVLAVEVLRGILGDPQGHAHVLEVLERLQQGVTARRRERIEHDEHAGYGAAGVENTANRCFLFRRAPAQTSDKAAGLALSPAQGVLALLPGGPCINVEGVG